MTRKTYCGNLLWQSGLTLLARAKWDLIGSKSDIEQIIGNAVPVNLGAFVGRALTEFDVLKNHRRIRNNDLNSVDVFLQYAEPKQDDIMHVDLR